MRVYADGAFSYLWHVFGGSLPRPEAGATDAGGAPTRSRDAAGVMAAEAGRAQRASPGRIQCRTGTQN